MSIYPTNQKFNNSSLPFQELPTHPNSAFKRPASRQPPPTALTGNNTSYGLVSERSLTSNRDIRPLVIVGGGDAAGNLCSSNQTQNKVPELHTLSKVIYSFPNGNRYEGECVQGIFQGWGTLTYANGDRYIGSFMQGMPNGQGIYQHVNGDFYKGEMLDGKKHGFGTLYFANGEQYAGQFLLGSMTQGNYRFSNGACYTGSFLNQKYHGFGILSFSTGDRYIGEFLQGKGHGQGILCYLTGDSYQGSFANGQFHGNGTYYFADGSRYEGGYAAHLRDGEGTYYYPKDPELKLKTRWCKNEPLLNRDALAEPAFLSCMLNKTLFPGNVSIARILSDYFMQIPAYEIVAKKLRSAIDPGSAAEIYRKLCGPSGQQLLPLISRDHVMLLEIISNGKNFIFKIFNAGQGLNRWHQRALFSNRHYQTMLQIQIPQTSVNEAVIESLLQTFTTIHGTYEFIYSLEGAIKIEGKNGPWQVLQKGENCVMESTFAFLKNELGDEMYHEMRMGLFDACIQAVLASKNPKALSFLQKLEQKKTNRINRKTAGEQNSRNTEKADLKKGNDNLKF